MKVGCHISIAGGIPNAPAKAAKLGCEVFQIFSRSPRGGSAPKLRKETVSRFWKEMSRFGFSDFVIHTPYFINFGSKSKKIFFGSVALVREELERASQLKSAYVITHLGSYKDLGRSKGFAQLILGLNKCLRGYQGQAELLLENSAGAGDLMGGDFKELSDILSHPLLKKYQIGICFDTAHAFASGYDLRTWAAVHKTFEQFDKIVGLKEIAVLHANDSKVGLGEKKDRHEHIGKGKIGKTGFGAIINYSKLKGRNIYTETKESGIKEDVKILKDLRQQLK